MVKDLDLRTWKGIGSLEKYSYRPLETEPNMIINFPAGRETFDDYLGLLNARYRKMARRVVRQVELAGYRVERLRDLSRVAGTLYGLFLQVHEEASVRPAALAPGYLPLLSEALGPERFRCTAVRRPDAEPTGFVTTVKDGDTAVGYYIGFDRPEKRASTALLPVTLLGY